MTIMTSVGILAALLASAALADPGVEYTAPAPTPPPAVETGPVGSIEMETGKLQDALSNPATSKAELHGRAEALFGGMLRPEASAIGGIELRGWEKPDTSSEDSVAGLIDRSGNTIAAAKFKTNAAPPPSPELVDAWHSGRALAADGMAKYDDEDQLGKGTLGAFLYTKTEAIGIVFNKHFKSIQRWLGDEFAAATAIHESAHARDHAKGELNAKEVKKGEKQAFETEYKYLRLVDPKGQKLAWARVNFCRPDTMAPKLVCDYLTHLAKISWHGEKGDWDGLVSSLGYQDRAEDPFAHAHGPDDGHGH